MAARGNEPLSAIRARYILPAGTQPSRDARAVGASVGVVGGVGRATGMCLQPVRS